jgi:hypothetical protein
VFHLSFKEWLLQLLGNRAKERGSALLAAYWCARIARSKELELQKLTVQLAELLDADEPTISAILRQLTFRPVVELGYHHCLKVVRYLVTSQQAATQNSQLLADLFGAELISQALEIPGEDEGVISVLLQAVLVSAVYFVHGVCAAAFLTPALGWQSALFVAFFDFELVFVRLRVPTSLRGCWKTLFSLQQRN